MNPQEPQKLYHFYGGCCTQGLFFIKKTGNCFSFGSGKYGELANSESYKTKNRSNFPTPKIAKNFPKFGKVSKIAKGTLHTLFLMSSTEDVYGVGNSDGGSLSVKEKEVLSPILVSSKALKGVKIGDIVCASGFSVLLGKNGAPYTCGWNGEGQCGVGTNENIYSAIPMKIKEKIIQIDCGIYFTVLLTNKRNIYKTGRINTRSHMTRSVENFPIKLKLKEKVKYFRAGCMRVLVVGESEQLYGIGNNECNQIEKDISANDIEVLTKITSLKGKVKDIKCSFRDSYALMDNNDLYGWGGNFFGQSKGNGTVTETPPYNPIPFKMKSNVEQIEVSVESCFVFCKEGVYVCGSNENGGLGMGNTTNLSTLTLNKALSNIKRTDEKFFIPKFDLQMIIFDVIIKT